MTDSIDGAVIVIAKTPHPGRVKTRLVPPLTPHEAAEVAWACLTDTLAAVARSTARRRVLLLDGEPGSWIPDGFEVITQRGNGLADRLVAGFVDVDDDAVLIAMDTPQVQPAQLDRALHTLRTCAEAVLGRSPDGGFWLLGLRRGIPAATVLDGVPMSTRHTGAAQFRRLQELGVSVTLLEELRDIDKIDDVLAVSELIPNSATARLAARLKICDDHAAPSAIGGLLDEIRSGMRRVHPVELGSEIERGALVVDTRPIEQRHRDGPLPGAVIIDRNVLEWRLDPTSADRIPQTSADRRIIIVCNEGYSSTLAAATLQRLGLAQATDLVDGFQGLLRAGLISSAERAGRGPRAGCWPFVLPVGESGYEHLALQRPSSASNRFGNDV